MTTQSPVDDLMDAVRRAMEHSETAIHLGIVTAHHSAKVRVAVLAYALAMALNDDPGYDSETSDLQENALEFARINELATVTRATVDVTGTFGAAGFAIYQALTNPEDAQWLFDVLRDITADVRGED